MATFLDDISIYNAKAAAAIAQAVSEGDTPKANLMSSLKTTANDATLPEAIRLNSLTALINVGNLLDIPLPPYFPVSVAYADSVTYVGIHNDLSGLQGGAPGEYYHLTAAERTDILNKVSPSELQFANLTDSPYDNALLSTALTSKQDVLSGVGFVKINGTTISYDNSTYLTSVSGPAGGDLSGTYPNPTIASSVVMGKTMFGWNPSYPYGTGAISSSDSLLVAIQKLNASVENIVTNPSGVSSVALNMTPTTIFSSSTTPASGAVTLAATLISQTANTFLAAPNGTNGVPSFRTISVDDIPALSPDPSGTYGGGSPLEIPIITVDAQGRVTSVATTAATGSGTVTSVNIDPPSYFSVGSPVTTSGDILLSWDNTISPNTVLAGPATGTSTATPIFRSLVAADIPTIAISQVGGLQNALDSKMDYALNDGEIFIGNAVNAPANKSLSGDVTMTREGVVTIEPGVVDFAKMQDITSGNLLGRWDSVTPGSIQEVGLNPSDFILDNTTGILSLASPTAPILDTKGSLLTYSQSVGQQVQLYADFDGKILITNSNLGEGLEWVDVTGDITLDTATPSGAATISAGAVTLAKMANLTADSFIGNNTGGGVPMELSVTDATAMLNIFSTTGTDKGLVPGSNGVASTYYLDASGNWSIPGGGAVGTVTTVSVVSANGFAGTVANASTTPAITLTTSVTGLLKGNGTAISAASAGTDYVAPGAITTSGLTMATSRLLGRTAASTGAVEEISVGASLSLSSTTLSLNTANANTWSALQTFAGSSGIYIGEAGTASGVARFIGTTSGYVALKGPDSGDSKTYILPAAVGTTGQFLKLSSSTTGELAWADAGTGSGTVTSVSWTGGIVSVATATTTPAFTIAGTSGGVVYFSSGTTWASSGVLAANALVIGGGAGTAPSTITTGTGVVTALGVNVGSAGAFVVNGGALGTPSSGTLTSCTGLLLSTGVTGTLAVTNGGTGQTSYTDGQLLIGNTSTGGLSKATLTAGTNITITNGNGTITIDATGGGGSTSLTTLTAATGTANLSNANSTITWNWNSNTTANAFVLASTGITTASLFSSNISGTAATSAKNISITNSATTNTSGRGLDISISGGTNSGNTFGAYISNTKSGTTSTNTALYLTASGGTTNYALDIGAGILRMAAGTASVPQMVLTPSSLSGSFTGNTNGSIWYDTTSSTSSLYLYKDTGTTKLVTMERNQDLATGSSSGVLISDTSGNITKSADLTALGIFAQTSTVTVANTNVSTTLIGTITGSNTLPANFFGVGKTIVVYVSGTLNTTSSPTCTLNLTIGGVNVGSIVLTHNSALTTVYYDAQFTITCRTTGTTGTVQYSGLGRCNVGTATSSATFFQSSTTSSSINTTGTLVLDLQALWSTANASNSVTASILTAQYIN